METRCDIKRYSQRILREIGESLQIDIKCEPVTEEGKDKYYSKILKSGVVTDGQTLITSAVISLNYKKLDTISKVRRAISHELAHLFPTQLDKLKTFTARWSYWNRNLKLFERALDEYTIEAGR